MYQRLEDALSNLIGGQKPIKGTLGYTIDGTYRVMVAEDAARYYVRFGDGSFAQVYHRGRVSPVPDLPVVVGFDSAGNMVIVGGDPDRTGLFDGTHEVGPHSHARGSGMEFDIDPRLLTPVKAAPLAGMTVEVAQGAYRYQGALRWWSGGTITLTPPGSAHTWAWAAVGLDPVTETLVSASGSAVVVSAPLEPSTIPAIALAGAIPLAAVRVRNGQTELDEGDFEDLRYALAVIPADIPVDVPAALDDLGDVNTSGAADGDVLTYASGTWIAQTPASGGAGAGSKTRLVGTVMHDETLTGSGIFDVSSIPQDYDWLEIRLTLRSTVAALNDNVYVFFNNDTTTGNYQNALDYAGNTGSGTANTRAATPSLAISSGANSPAGYFNRTVITVPEYTNANIHKISIGHTAEVRDASTAYVETHAHHWKNTAAINRIQVRPDGYATDNFAAGSRMILIGWKAEAIGGGAADYSTANVSNPPTDAELDSAFGEPGDVGAGFVGIVNDNGSGTDEYLCWADGSAWWYAAGTKAV